MAMSIVEMIDMLLVFLLFLASQPFGKELKRFIFALLGHSDMPVISTNRTCATIEFVASGKSGRLFRAGDSIALKNSMLESSQTPDSKFEHTQLEARLAGMGYTLNLGVERFMLSAKDLLQNWPIILFMRTHLFRGSDMVKDGLLAISYPLRAPSQNWVGTAECTH